MVLKLGLPEPVQLSPKSADSLLKTTRNRSEWKNHIELHTGQNLVEMSDIDGAVSNSGIDSVISVSLRLREEQKLLTPSQFSETIFIRGKKST